MNDRRVRNRATVTISTRYKGWQARLAGLFLASLLLVSVVATAEAAVGEATGRRLALVVGNSAYKSVYSLKNAVNDSNAMAEVLEQLGFEVTNIQNAGTDAFRKAVDDFARKAEGAEATLFFFSGHGFQLQGVNYLVPSDASLRSVETIEQETLRLDSIISELQARNRQTLIFLDACRNNPLPESIRGKSGEGLAQVETGVGTFVAFATQPGNITRDGVDENSPFTTALLNNIETPGISISDMMIRVRNEVEEETLQQQTPWDQSSLRSQFYFNPESEDGDALTDEDKELLLSLDPELRKKFEARFGLRIESVEDGADTAETAEAEPLVPQIQLSAVEDEPEQQVAAAPAEPISPLLTIASGDSDPGPQDMPETVALPPARPEAEPEPEPEQQVAMLPPTPEALAPVRTEPAPAAPATPARTAEPAPTPLQPPSAGAAAAAAEPAPAAALAPAAVPAIPTRTEETGREQIVAALPATGAAAPAAPLAPAAVENAARAVSTAEALAPVAPAQRVIGTEIELASIAPQEQAPASIVANPDAPSLYRKEEAPAAAAEVPAPAAAPEAETKLASISPAEIKPDLTAPAIPPAEPQQDPEALARAIQEQLARLGCYRNAIDGDWGSGSAKALLRYYATKKAAPDNLEPNPELLALLTQEETVVCKLTESAQPKATVTKKRSEKPVAEKPARRSAPTASADKPAKKQPAKRVASDDGAKKSLKKSFGSGAFR